MAGSRYTKVQFRSKEFDTANCFDNVTNFRFTPNVAGYYQVSATVRFTTLNLGEWVAIIYKNGVAYKSGSAVYLSSAGIGQSHVSALVYLNGSSDYLEVFAYSDATMSILANQAASFFQAVMVRGA